MLMTTHTNASRNFALSCFRRHTKAALAAAVALLSLSLAGCAADDDATEAGESDLTGADGIEYAEAIQTPDLAGAVPKSPAELRRRGVVTVLPTEETGLAGILKSGNSPTSPVGGNGTAGETPPITP